MGGIALRPAHPKKAFALLLIASSALIVIKGSDKTGRTYPISPPVDITVVPAGARHRRGISRKLPRHRRRDRDDTAAHFVVRAFPNRSWRAHRVRSSIAIGITVRSATCNTGGAAGLFAAGMVHRLCLVVRGAPSHARRSAHGRSRRAAECPDEGKTLHRVFGAVLLAPARSAYVFT